MAEQERRGPRPPDELQHKILYLELLDGHLLRRLEQNSPPFSSIELHEYRAALEDLKNRLEAYRGRQNPATARLAVEHCLNLIDQLSNDTPTDPRIKLPVTAEASGIERDGNDIIEQEIHELVLNIQARLIAEHKTEKYIRYVTKKIETEIKIVLTHIAGTKSPEALLDYLAKFLENSAHLGHGLLATSHLHDLNDAEKEKLIHIIRQAGEQRLVLLSQKLKLDVDRFVRWWARLNIKKK